MINDLIKKGFAYENKKHVYFEVKKFSDYGKLSNKNLKDFCESGYATYVDYHTSMKDKRNGLRDDYTYWRDDFNGYDGVHPNKKGYLKMERIISKTLKKTL